MKVKVTQLCPTLFEPMDYTVHGIFRARILEWVAYSFSRGSSIDQIQVSRIAGGFFTSWVIQGKPKNTGVGNLSLLQQIFLTQELNQGHPGIEPGSPALQVDSLPTELIRGSVIWYFYMFKIITMVNLVTICHHSKILYSYQLFSPYCTSHICDSFIL